MTTNGANDYSSTWPKKNIAARVSDLPAQLESNPRRVKFTDLAKVARADNFSQFLVDSIRIEKYSYTACSGATSQFQHGTQDLLKSSSHTRLIPPSDLASFSTLH